MKSTGIAVIGSLLFVASLAAKPVETNSAPAQTVPASSRLTMGGIVTTPERKSSPLFTGNELPTPPKQHASWTAPKSELPTNYVSATTLLFDQGMADPRGCDYREIEVGTGNVWQGDGGVVKVHGWVLPGRGAEKFAVCWNGMVYPLVTIGTNADLDADVAMLTTNGNFNHWYQAYNEPTTVSEKISLGLKGCFLLRLGRADLAEKLWLAQEHGAADFQSEMRRRFSQTNDMVATNGIKLSASDPYQGWASDWAWMMFDRMICAHERGDEKLALFTARQLAAARSQIETTCAARGFKRPNSWNTRGQTNLPPYLDFLGQFPDILADLERREKEGPHISILTTGITNITDQSTRIATLIHDLDLVGARQWGQPGGVSLWQDDIIGALTAEGDAAVEPLLYCLEQDKRLTRSVSFWRDFGRNRTVIPVSHCAETVLKSILQADFSSAAEMSVYWDKYKYLKIEDRWYAILQDDSARARWQEAAGKITEPENITHHPDGWTSTRPAATNAPVRLRGEPLRSRTNPTVTELLTRRALEQPAEADAHYDLGACCRFAEDLAKWDASAAQDVARTLSQRAATTMKYTGENLGGHLAQLALIRAGHGDAHAFDDYAAWIISTTPEQLGYQKSQQLEPFKQFPTNEILAAAAEKMFADTNSAWTHLPWKDNPGGEMYDSGLFIQPAFRVMLARELEKTNVFGTITWRDSRLEFNTTNSSGSSAWSFPENETPTNGTTNPIRWCDWLAMTLAKDKQVPFFNPFASVEKRDADLKADEEKLRGK